MIKFPVSSQCRQCLCSFYYLGCCGRGSSVPWVNHSSLLSSPSRLPPRAAAGREADSSCKPQEDAFLLPPISPFKAGTTTVHVSPALLWSSILDLMLCGASLARPGRGRDGVRGDGVLAPAFLSCPGCPKLLIRSAFVCSSFSALLFVTVVGTEG